MGRPVAVVSGAARGIGLETARRLAPTHQVALLDLDAAGAERAAAQIGRDAVWAGCDIADAESVRAAVADVAGRCGGMDVAIANAGVATAGALRHLDPDVLAAQLNVNLTGSWRFIHACLPHVIERRGYVLGVSSASALVAPAGLGHYAASKAGFEHLLDVLRVEVAHLGVDVGIAFFSWIDTDMVRGAERSHPAFAAMRGKLRGPTGRTLPVGAAADALVRAAQRRERTVTAPGFVRVAYWLRGLIGPLTDRDARRLGPAVDRATAEMVAERGAFDAAMRPGDAGSVAAARSLRR
ncbi:MAG TPA: SDR family NAD(P)-dependent oxidoreductase [Solirubrobacteraceae bacterium]|nr:SDR family NAD(P)-dependent oxidoreductase [Solirubrobacteraceae bacterium]